MQRTYPGNGKRSVHTIQDLISTLISTRFANIIYELEKTQKSFSLIQDIMQNDEVAERICHADLSPTMHEHRWPATKLNLHAVQDGL